MKITKETLTAAMADINTCCSTINDIISPNKKLQPHKGAQLGHIHQTSEGFWSEILLPQWVVCSDTCFKSYRFTCTESGDFLAWVE